MEFLKFHTATEPTVEGQPQMARPSSPLNLASIFGRVLSIGMIALAFLIPITFLPTTSEFYEFNKQALLIFGTIILMVAWFAKMWVEKEIRFVRTPLDLPILLFVLAYIISTATSLNLTTSILGHFGRFNGGLVSIICYTLLYFVYVNNVRSIDQVKKVAMAISFSGVVLAVLGLASYFGIYPFGFLGDFAKNRFFTPVGSPNGLSYFLLASLPVTLGLAATSRRSLWLVVYFFGALFSFAYIALADVSVKPLDILPISLTVLSLIYLAVFFFFTREATFGKNRTLFILLIGLFLALTAFSVPAVRDRLPQDLRDLPKEVNLDWGPSWQITASTLRDRPLVGSGPDTFLFDFTRFRDVALNATPYWNLRFDRANSELLQVISTLGLVGLAVFLFLIYKILRLGLSYLPREKELETHTLSVGFAIGVLALVAHMVVFGYLSTTTSFLLWISLAMLIRLWVGERQVAIKSTVVSIPVGGESSRDILPGLVFFPMLLLAILLFFVFGRAYAAESYFQRSLEAARANNGRDTYELQRQGIQSARISLSAFDFRLDRDIYHTTFSGTNLLIADSLARQDKPDATTIQTLVTQSINEATAAKDLNPWNVNNWEQLASVYRSLVGVTQTSDQFAQFAEQAYIQAINLDPANARIRDALGTFYSQIKRHDDAINTLIVASRLKPDLAAAHFDLAKALVARADVAGTTKDKQRDYLTAAKTEYENTLKLVTAGSADETEVKKAVDEVGKRLTALGGPVETATTPTIPPTASPSGTKR